MVTLAANMEVNAERAKQIESEIAKAKIILCQSEIQQEAVLEAFKIAKKYHCK